MQVDRQTYIDTQILTCAHAYTDSHVNADAHTRTHTYADTHARTQTQMPSTHTLAVHINKHTHKKETERKLC